jgi:hypothetical protein
MLNFLIYKNYIENKHEQEPSEISQKDIDLKNKHRSANVPNGNKFVTTKQEEIKRQGSMKTGNHKNSLTHEDVVLTLPSVLQTFKKKLEAYIETQKNKTLKNADFERSGGAPEIQDTYEGDQEGANNDPNEEGRKSYIRIKNKKNWPPTMEDLLEYISIYSQMNNIKFTTLNYEVYYEKQNKSVS